MAKAKKLDTVFMEYLPASLPSDTGWSTLPSIDTAAAMKKIVRYLLVSIAFLGITLAVFYALFAWLVNQ